MSASRIADVAHARELRLLEGYSQASVDAGLGAIEALPPDSVARATSSSSLLTSRVSTHRPEREGSHTNDEDLEPGSIERATIRAPCLSIA